MALVTCPECGQKISERAESCPHCGYPTSGQATTIALTPTQQASAQVPERELLVARQSMFRNHPLAFSGCVILILATLALAGQFALGGHGSWALLFAIVAAIVIVILGVWSLKARSVVLTITNRRSTLRTGLLDRFTTEVMHEHVRVLDVRQTAMQRVLGVGTVAIGSAGDEGLEIEAPGIPSPQTVADLIRRQQK